MTIIYFSIVSQLVGSLYFAKFVGLGMENGKAMNKETMMLVCKHKNASM